MKIGIDCRTADESAGIGAYTRHIAKLLPKLASEHSFVLFFNSDSSAWQEFAGANVEIKFLPDRRWQKYLPIIYSHFWLAASMSREKADAILFPANIIPLGYSGRAILTIHDLAVYKYPELFPDKLIDFDRRIVVPRSIRKADRIIAISLSTKADIIELFGVSDEKVKVVYEGVNQPLLTSPFAKGRNNAEQEDIGSDSPPLRKGESEGVQYLLFIGTIEPRKNLEFLIRAYTKFVQATGWMGELRLAGGRGWKNEGVFAAMAEANKELGREAVKYLGYIDEGQKTELYQSATAFVFPSLYEGFGLPVIEAMSYGAPVITSNNSSLKELAGESAILIDEKDEAELIEALKSVTVAENAAETRKKLSELGRKKSQELIWAKCSTETIKVIEDLK